MGSNGDNSVGVSLVPSPPGGVVPPADTGIVRMTPRGFMSSLRPTSRVESGILAKALGECDIKCSENETTKINAVHLVIRSIDRVDQQTGEVYDSTRVAIIDDAGIVFAIESDVVIDCLSNICAAFGPPPWQPSLPIVVKRVKGGRFGRYFVAEVDLQSLAPPAKAVKK